MKGIRMKDDIKLLWKFPVTPDLLYAGWLNSKVHSEFTGGQEAFIVPRVGGEFNAWGGYIFGKTLELEPNKRILQSWRTTDFPPDAPDSLLEILLEPEGRGTSMTILHRQLPPSRVKDFLQGWQDFYYQPMSRYFKMNVK